MGDTGVRIKTDTSRALENLVLEQKKPIFLICSTEKGEATAVDVLPGTGNVGTGGISTISAGATQAKNEIFELECVSTAVNGGTFSVTGSVSGLQTNQITVGVPYVSDGGEVSLTLIDSFVDFSLGDKFTFKTTATKVDTPTPLASLADFDSYYGTITSGANVTLSGVGFKADDYARAMVITALKNGAPGGLYVVTAKVHGVTRTTAPTNAEYQVAIDACAAFGTKIVVHESLDSADQIDLSQFAFDQSAPDSARFTFAYMALGIAQSLSAYTTRSAALDGGVSRGLNSDDPTPYALISPAPIDENGNVTNATAIAGAVAIACLRANESDPAMPIVNLELRGFGGLEKEWLDGSTSEHDLLNDGGVSTLKTRGSRISPHRVVTAIQNSTAQAKQYTAWHDEPGVWINFFLKEDLLRILTSSPYDRTKNTVEIRDLMTGDVRARLRLLETIEWPSSSGAGVIENVADHEASVSFDPHPSNPNKAVGTLVYDSVNALYGVDITAHVIV